MPVQRFDKAVIKIMTEEAQLRALSHGGRGVDNTPVAGCRIAIRVGDSHQRDQIVVGVKHRGDTARWPIS